MTTDPIPVIEANGTHREVGEQVGEKMKLKLQRILPRLRNNLPAGISWDDMLLKGWLCLAHSRATCPQFVEELEGMAEAAEVPFEELFLAICEELWEPAAWHAGMPTLARGCTDFVARGQATADGSILVAHNNDLGPEAELEEEEADEQGPGAEIDFVVGEGSAEIEIATHSGDIRIRCR